MMSRRCRARAISPRSPRPMMTTRMLAFFLFSTTSVAAAAIFGGSPRITPREAQSAELGCAAMTGAVGFWGSGQLTRSWTPPGMSYRLLRKPMLAANQQFAVALAAAACGAAVARVAHQSSNEMAVDLMKQIGRTSAGIGDRVDGFVEGFRERARRAREDRERAERRRWLKNNAKPARMHVNSY